MSKRSKLTPESVVRLIIGLALSIIVGFLGGLMMTIQLKTGEKVTTIKIENGTLEISEDKEVPKLEEVDGGHIDIRTFASRGSFFRTDTYSHFIEDTIGQCVIEGNIYGAQCVSLAQAFWTNYAGRGITDCGTGAARGIWECKYQNAGDDFEIVEGSQNLQPGDWVVFNSGTYGHIGMVYEKPTDKYVPLYGENQGGKKCDEGGSQPNYIKLSDKTMLGAFRPKSYIIVPEPVEPESPDTGVIK